MPFQPNYCARECGLGVYIITHQTCFKPAMYFLLLCSDPASFGLNTQRKSRKNKMEHHWLSKRNLLHQALSIALIILLFTPEGLSTHRRVLEPADDGTICGVDRQEIPVEIPGCEPTTTVVPVCTGKCNSFTLVKNVPPFQVQYCDCCKPKTSRPKPRTLVLTCGEDRHTERRRLYFPHILECQCGSCVSSV